MNHDRRTDQRDKDPRQVLAKSLNKKGQRHVKEENRKPW